MDRPRRPLLPGIINEYYNMKRLLITFAMLLLGGFSSCAQEAPKAIDLGVSVKWAAKDIGPEADIPEGWRLPTLAEIRELREACTQSVEEKDGAEWIVFTA